MLGSPFHFSRRWTETENVCSRQLRIAPQHYYKNYPNIIVRDCPLSQSLTIKMSETTWHRFLQCNLAIIKLLVRTPTTNSDLAPQLSKALHIQIKLRALRDILLDSAPKRKEACPQAAGCSLAPPRKICQDDYQDLWCCPTLAVRAKCCERYGEWRC